MKFLFDQSADFRLIAHLRERGHDVTAISRDYPHSLADEEVLAIARSEQRILLVADRDFGELILHQGLAHAGVIFFRLPGAPLQTKIEHLTTVLESYTDDLARGAFLVVSAGQIRIANRSRS
jgi:predicted nuclease of predicted toxin-antitoxin system